ncbi:hypothetical protein [Microbulbifer agarilyticus]|uniref:hypothetical protein n=1 Tax=Microbulbifer agarilyticus TaxID=260552 RepID=UPI001CD1CAF4|nr:hypothetical protein [Microbulbifer agarilyticus]MCA0901370.1 hypothetical protein [Microbulbifer agarilyticus]
MTEHAIASSNQQFEAQLAEVLGQMHARADRLAQSLFELQKATHPWQSYLLQPGFATEAAERLGATFDSPFTLAGALFANLDYGEQYLPGDARNTLQIPGLLAVPAETIALAQELNASKVKFQQLTAAIKESLSPRPALERDRLLRDMLGNAGFSRAHLRQCYRQILLCPERPDAVALSWIKARKSIRKVNVAWCEKKLVQLDPQGQDPGIQYQRQLLAGLHKSQHNSLRQIQMQSRPNLQVAEIFRDKQEEYRQVGYAAMPVLVKSEGDRTLPEFTRVDHNPPLSQRRTRRDLRIEKTPFLAALRVHLVSDSPN